MGIVSKIAKGAGKHLKDLSTKKTLKQRMTEEATKGQRTYREGQRKAGAVGAAGAGTASAVGSAINEKNKREAAAKEKEKGKGNDTRAKAADYPTYKKGTESSKAFKDAFNKAKDDGKKSFTFEGRSYKVEEKEMMKGGAVKKMMGGGYGTKKGMK